MIGYFGYYVMFYIEYEPYVCSVSNIILITFTLLDAPLITFTDKNSELNFEGHLHIHTSAQISSEAFLFHL